MYPFDFDYSYSSRLGNKQVGTEIMAPNSGLQKSIKTNQLLFDFLFNTSCNAGSYCDVRSWFSVKQISTK